MTDRHPRFASLERLVASSTLAGRRSAVVERAGGPSDPVMSLPKLPTDLAAFWNKYLAVELLTSLPDYMGGLLLWGCEHAVASNRALQQAYSDAVVWVSDLFIGEFRGESSYLVYCGLASGDDTLTIANFTDPRDEW